VIAERTPIVRLRLERRDVAPHRVQIGSDPRDLGVERDQLVASNEGLRVDDLRDRPRVREQGRVTRPRGFELLP
jgi:hypothetical protein